MIIAFAVWLPSLRSNTMRRDENFKIFINSLVDEEIISNQNRLRILQSQTLFFPWKYPEQTPEGRTINKQPFSILYCPLLFTGIASRFHTNWFMQLCNPKNSAYAWLRQTSKFHQQASFVNKIFCICTFCAWVFFSTLLPWEFISVKLRLFLISKRGLVVKFACVT